MGITASIMTASTLQVITFIALVPLVLGSCYRTSWQKEIHQCKDGMDLRFGGGGCLYDGDVMGSCPPEYDTVCYGYGRLYFTFKINQASVTAAKAAYANQDLKCASTSSLTEAGWDENGDGITVVSEVSNGLYGNQLDKGIFLEEHAPPRAHHSRAAVESSLGEMERMVKALERDAQN